MSALAIGSGGCSSSVPGKVLAFTRNEDGSYQIAPRTVPALTDPATLSGALGTVEHGGQLTGDDLSGPWSGGVPLSVEFADDSGVAVPLDPDGLALFSFYAHLSDVRDTLEAYDEPVDALFPLDMAWNPAVSPLFELSPADNAAYATGQHLFVLLPDGGDHAVPLIANAGVVAHETGHMVFHAAMTGDPYAPPIITAINTESANWQASLHEGAADAMAALWLDDPRFLDPSLQMDARALDADPVYTSALDPAFAASEAKDNILYFYDPYPLGTVWARSLWAVREETDDRDGTLTLLFAAMHGFDASGEMNGDGFASALLAAAPTVGTGVTCAVVRAVLDGAFGNALDMPACPEAVVD